MWQTMRLSRNPTLAVPVTNCSNTSSIRSWIEAAVPKVGFDVGPQLELTALLGGPVDPCRRQPLQMVVTLIRTDHMNRLVATLEAVRDERKQHAIVLVVAVEERAHMASSPSWDPAKGMGAVRIGALLSCACGVLGSAPERDDAWRRRSPRTWASDASSPGAEFWLEHYRRQIAPLSRVNSSNRASAFTQD